MLPTTRTTTIGRWRWISAGLLALVLIAVGASVFFAFAFTGPQRRPVREEAKAEIGFPVEEVNFAATDGVALGGWFVAGTQPGRGVILLHGNGSTRAQMVARARLLRTQGWAVLLYDARGHGRSGGDRVSVGLQETRDLAGALAFMQSRGLTELGCIGASQGGATIALAAPLPAAVRWVVLESVYPDIATALDRRFRRTLGVPGWLAGALMVPVAEWRLGVPATEIAPVRAVARLQCPLLVVSGERDEHTTADDTRALFAAAREPKELWLVPGAAHVDLYGAAGAAYERRIVDFISAH